MYAYFRYNTLIVVVDYRYHNGILPALFTQNCQNYTQTVAAQHNTRHKANVRHTERKMEVRWRREKHKTLFVFPSPKTLYYYWLLIVLIQHRPSLWTNKKSGFYVWHAHIAHLLVFCCIAVRCVPTRSGPVLSGPVQSSSVHFGPLYQIISSTVVCSSLVKIRKILECFPETHL